MKGAARGVSPESWNAKQLRSINTLLCKLGELGLQLDAGAQLNENIGHEN